jgi:hypothetical protein
MTNRVSGDHPDTLITEVRGSYGPNTHNFWLLFVHEKVTHAFLGGSLDHAFSNYDEIKPTKCIFKVR